MPARYGAWLLALFGVALAGAALWRPAVPAADGPAGRLLVQLPGWVQTLLITAMIIEFLAIVLVLVQTPRRKREGRRTSRSRLSPVAAAVLLLPLLTATMFCIYALQNLDENLLRLVLVDLNPFGPGPGGDPTQSRVTVTLPWLDMGLSAGVSVAAMVIIALSVLAVALNPPWKALAGWLRAARQRRGASVAGIARGFAAGRRELELGHDPRSAVIACYRQCEIALATRRRRQMWETPREFLHAALAALELPGQAVATLLRVFERARYSELPVTQQNCSDALHALDAICQELHRRGEEQGAA